MKKFSDINTEWFEEEGSLKKKLNFKDFATLIEFVNKVAKIADQINHHPKIIIDYNKVEIITTTHDEGNVITEKDYQLCQEIDKINF